MNAEILELDTKYNTMVAEFNQAKNSCDKEDPVELAKLSSMENELAKLNIERRRVYNNLYVRK